MGQSRSPSVSPSRQVLSSQDQEVLSLFELFSQEGNPFERHIDNKDEETEDVLASNGVGSALHYITWLLQMYYRFIDTTPVVGVQIMRFT